MMNLQQKLLMIWKKPASVWHYFLGNYRYKLFYSRKWKWLIRKHILQQIEYRILWMDERCFELGYCKICQCSTTALQMCNKPCDKPCYPTMMRRRKWEKFIDFGGVFKDKNGIWKMAYKDKELFQYTNDKQIIHHKIKMQ